ncbi:MAG: tyrosine-type recombinase/integrase [Acidobacteria bacterium]|nr:tyrosine-type recombinase/integrase [Acidobacteriota bacterium]
MSASTQNQALAAVAFLYRHVLQQPLGALGGIVRARMPERLLVVMARSGKGGKDRLVPLPSVAKAPLAVHLAAVKRMHDRDRTHGFGRVVLPDALARKFPNAATEWGWQFVFPAARICRDPRWGGPTRFHLHETVVQRAVARAAREAGLAKRVSCHTFRHHADVSTTMIYTHVVNRGGLGVRNTFRRFPSSATKSYTVRIRRNMAGRCRLILFR